MLNQFGELCWFNNGKISFAIAPQPPHLCSHALWVFSNVCGWVFHESPSLPNTLELVSQNVFWEDLSLQSVLPLGPTCLKSCTTAMAFQINLQPVLGALMLIALPLRVYTNSSVDALARHDAFARVQRETYLCFGNHRDCEIDILNHSICPSWDQGDLEFPNAAWRPPTKTDTHTHTHTRTHTHTLTHTHTPTRTHTHTHPHRHAHTQSPKRTFCTPETLAVHMVWSTLPTLPVFSTFFLHQIQGEDN